VKNFKATKKKKLQGITNVFRLFLDICAVENQAFESPIKRLTALPNFQLRFKVK